MELERALVPNTIIYDFSSQWLPPTHIFISFNAPQDPPSIPTPTTAYILKETVKMKLTPAKEGNSWKIKTSESKKSKSTEIQRYKNFE